MKKILAIFVVFIFVGGGALFAQIDLSVGGGITFGLDLASEKYDGEKQGDTESSIDFGLYGFFDATYAEIDLGLNINTYKPEGADDAINTISLVIGLLGKYPIDLGGITVFPLAGIEYSLALIAKAGDEKADDPGDYASRLWIRLGGGADIDINRYLYVRPSLLWGIGLKTKMEKDMIDIDDNLSYFTHGFKLRLAAGYRF